MVEDSKGFNSFTKSVHSIQQLEKGLRDGRWDDFIFTCVLTMGSL